MFDLDNDYSPEAIETKKKVEEILDYIIDENCTLSYASDNLCIPKSTLSNYINTYGEMYFYDKYSIVRAILKNNKDNRFKPKSQWRRRDKKVW